MEILGKSVEGNLSRQFVCLLMESYRKIKITNRKRKQNNRELLDNNEALVIYL